MSALVLEGGTFRPIFSCGVMDALLDCEIQFPYVIGVSAGISDGFSYVSKQKRRNYDLLMQLRHDKRYIGLRNYLTDRSLFGVKFVYETVPESLFPFDWKAFLDNPAEVRVGVTDAERAECVYLDGKKSDAAFTMLKATCAIPFFFPSYEIDGRAYYDGGICDPIPVRQAQKDGHDKLLVVLTRPASYKKTLSKANVWASRRLRKIYPKLAEQLLVRHTVYNETVAYCEALEREGRAVLLRPTEDVQIDSFEKDLSKMDRIYHYGYDEAMRRIDEIKALL